MLVPMYMEGDTVDLSHNQDRSRKSHSSASNSKKINRPTPNLDQNDSLGQSPNQQPQSQSNLYKDQQIQDSPYEEYEDVHIENQEVSRQDLDDAQQKQIFSETNDKRKTKQITKNRDKSRKNTSKLGYKWPVEEKEEHEEGKGFERTWSTTGVQRTEIIEAGKVEKYPPPTEQLQIKPKNWKKKQTKKGQRQSEHDSRNFHLMKERHQYEDSDEQILANRRDYLIRQNEKHRSNYDFCGEVPVTSSKRTVNLESIENKLKKRFQSVMQSVESYKPQSQEPINDLKSYIKGHIKQRRITYTCSCGSEYFNKKGFNQHLALAHPEDYEVYKERGKEERKFYNVNDYYEQRSQMKETQPGWHLDPEYQKSVKINNITFPKHNLSERFECVCGKFYENLRTMKIHIGQVHVNIHNEKGSFLDLMVYPTQNDSHYPFDQLVGKYPCGCGNTYSCSSALNLHIRNKHQGIKPPGSYNYRRYHEEPQQDQRQEDQNFSRENETNFIQENDKEKQHKENFTATQSSLNKKLKRIAHQIHNSEINRTVKAVKVQNNNPEINQKFNQSNSLDNNIQEQISHIKKQFYLSEKSAKAYQIFKKQTCSVSQNRHNQQENVGLPGFLPQITEDPSAYWQQEAIELQNSTQFEAVVEKMKKKQYMQRMNYLLFQRKVKYLKRLEEEVKKVKMEISSYMKTPVKIQEN